MSLSVRGVSVERGFDPRDFVMVGMGGGGPIHSVAIARQLHIRYCVTITLDDINRNEYIFFIRRNRNLRGVNFEISITTIHIVGS